MINIKRAECPPQLIDPNPEGEAWSRPLVRKTLWKMQHEKCCYCEAKIKLHGPTQNIEHHYPRKKYPEQKNNWNNLLHSCADCNQDKSCDFPLNAEYVPLIINPSDDNIDPEDHITFNLAVENPEFLGVPYAKNDSEFGEESIRLLKLDLEEKCIDRAVYLKDYIYDAYLKLVISFRSKDIQDFEDAKYEFEKLLSSKKIYSAFTREFARQKQMDITFGITIPVGSDIYPYQEWQI